MLKRQSSPFLSLFISLLCVAAAPTPALAQTIPLTTGPVRPLYRALGDVALDPQRVYKIREAAIDRDDVHFFLNDGIIAFTATVGGRITGAYFEGEGEVLIRPPDRRERASLGLFTGLGVLEEHFSSAYLRFNDDTFAELQPFLRPAEDAAAFADRNNPAARQLAIVDALRLAITFTAASPSPGHAASAPDRLLHARIASSRLGTFDVYFDTLAAEQIVVGQIRTVNDQSFYDLWMSFSLRSLRSLPSSSARSSGPSGPLWTRSAFTVDRYLIDAAIAPSLALSADAVLQGNVVAGGPRILLFELSRYLQLSSVESDGLPLEFIQNESIEGSQLARRGNDIVAVVFPAPLVSAKPLQIKFSYAGSVLSDAGGGLFTVGARGNWYPNRGIAMAAYDISFRFPQEYTLVATGTQLSSATEADTSLGHWRSDGNIPLAGFNLGKYIKTTANAGEIEVASYAVAPPADKPAAPEAPLSTPRLAIHSAAEAATPVSPSSVTTSPLHPPAKPVVQRAADSLLALQSFLGPYPFPTLALTERPGTDSQGWPGIIFLSNFVYLTPEQRAAAHVTPADNLLYESVMLPHELAHQWFGDRVSWASYHEQWLMEAISNYLALMLLEQRSPADFQLMLQNYRQLLANPSKDGLKNVEAGPVTLGARLSSYKFPAGYEIITYGRGTWLLHMLREMFRDAARSPANPDGSDQLFLSLLRSLYDRYQGREITNLNFQREIEAALPPSLWFEKHRSLEWFFDGWVNGTVFPRLEVRDVRVSPAAANSTVSATLRQLDAPDDLVTSVPVYGLLGEKKLYLGRVFAVGAETRFTLPAPPGVRRLVLDPNQTVLTAP